jgi:2-(1,2-epoxy-1,2-dihydrophenyl)acetyl-CoA isomerase
MDHKALTFEIRDGVATITLTRPASFNALDMQMSVELLDVANICSTDPAVRCVVLTGAGDKAFCAGGDVAGFVAAGDKVQRLVADMTTNLHTAISRFAWMRAPVIAAVNGVAAGAGLSIMAFCDLAIAADHARFTSAYTRIGLTPDGSSTYFLSHLIGRRRAMELYLTNRNLTAAEALDWGLVNRVVPAAELMGEVWALARQLADGPTEAHGGIKRLLNSAATESLESQMELETRTIIAMVATQDGREGVRAFVEKRRAKFEGK